MQPLPLQCLYSILFTTRQKGKSGEHTALKASTPGNTQNYLTAQQPGPSHFIRPITLSLRPADHRSPLSLLSKNRSRSPPRMKHKIEAKLCGGRYAPLCCPKKGAEAIWVPPYCSLHLKQPHTRSTIDVPPSQLTDPSPWPCQRLT